MNVPNSWREWGTSPLLVRPQVERNSFFGPIGANSLRETRMAQRNADSYTWQKTQVRRESRLTSSRAYELCRTDRMGRTIQLVRQDCITQRRRHLPLLKAQPKQPKSATIQVRVEEDIKLRLEKYAEFIDSSPAYVVTEALKLLFHKDSELSWLGQYSNNSEAHCPHTKSITNERGIDTASAQVKGHEPSPPTRYA